MGSMTILRDKILLDLPILLDDRDSAASTTIIIDTFQDELVHTYCDCCHGGVVGLDANAEIWSQGQRSKLDDLKKFIKKWENVWLLKMPEGRNNILFPEEEEIINLVDIEPLLDLLPRRRDDGLKFEDKNVRKLANLIAPVTFITATMVADHYGVGSDLALVRLYLDPYPEYSYACRNGSGDPRPEIIRDVMES
jgi:hypothetical protein